MSLNRQTAQKLIMGFIGINITYMVSGLLYEKLAKSSYKNIENNHYDRFRSSIGYCVVLYLITWLLSEVYCRFTLKKEEYVIIQKKKSFICGLIIAVSSISFMETLYLISYSFIMMAKSSSVLQVVLVGVFCTRVKNHTEKIAKNKIINSFVVTFGVIIFKLFDPETSFQNQISRQTQVLGFLLLLINLCADCFLPDFQAEIKYRFRPKPAQMLAEISKWSFLISFVCSIFTGSLTYTIKFMVNHPTFTFEIVGLAALSFIGQTFVYKMILNFQQHMVPLIISARKTFTVVLSLVYFGHRTSFGQIVAIMIPFSLTIWEFLDVIHKNEEKEKAKQKDEFRKVSEIEIQPSTQISSLSAQNKQKVQQSLIPSNNQCVNEQEQSVLRCT